MNEYFDSFEYELMKRLVMEYAEKCSKEASALAPLIQSESTNITSDYARDSVKERLYENRSALDLFYKLHRMEGKVAV
jgi:hypothetical protein